jgi:hypothetical protein
VQQYENMKQLSNGATLAEHSFQDINNRKKEITPHSVMDTPCPCGKG